jgi:hypothetical protein
MCREFCSEGLEGADSVGNPGEGNIVEKKL